MGELFKDYLAGIYKDIPCYVYEGLLGVFVIETIVLLAYKGLKNGWRWIVRLLLLEYIALIYCSTVIFRTFSEAISGHNFLPLWSYRAIISGKNQQLLPENIMNVVVFVPVGLLIGTQIAQKTQKGWLVAIAVGAGLSVGIETLQFVFNKGFSEVDDVMHNTIGCLIGYGIYRLICSIMYKFEGKR